MTPEQRLGVLCDAFREENVIDLRLKIHGLVKATDYIIERAYPMLKRVPGIDRVEIEKVEVNSKLINFELRKIKDYLKTLEALRDTPKTIVLLDDDQSQEVYWRERCDAKGINFHFFCNPLDFLSHFKEQPDLYSLDAMLVIDWYQNSSETGGEIARKLAGPNYGFTNIYITSSLEIDVSQYRGVVRGYVPKNPSWI